MSITLQFPRSQYPSLQVGDIGYYAIMNTVEIENPNGGDDIEIVAATGYYL